MSRIADREQDSQLIEVTRAYTVTGGTYGWETR